MPISPTYLHKRGHSILHFCLSGGSAGPVLRSQGSSEEDVAFALCARGRFDRFQCSLRPGSAALRHGVSPTYLHKRGHSLLCCCRCGGSAGPVLRSQGSSDKEELSRYAREQGLIAFNARSGPIPPPLRGG